jgi:macrodomain Ter protein organizer (MatP/YcbG family)
MRRKEPSPAITVLDELRALEHQPTRRANRLIARHLKCHESLKLSQVVAEAARKSLAHTKHLLEAPSEALPPLA